MSGRLRRQNDYQIAQWTQPLKYRDGRLASVRKVCPRECVLTLRLYGCIINEGTTVPESRVHPEFIAHARLSLACLRYREDGARLDGSKNARDKAREAVELANSRDEATRPQPCNDNDP